MGRARHDAVASPVLEEGVSLEPTGYQLRGERLGIHGASPTLSSTVVLWLVCFDVSFVVAGHYGA